MMEAASTSGMSVHLYQTTQRNIPEDSHLYTHCCENLKSCKVYIVFMLFIHECVCVFGYKIKQISCAIVLSCSGNVSFIAIILYCSQVPPYEPRIFPLLDEVYEKMLKAMPEGHPFPPYSMAPKKLFTKDNETVTSLFFFVGIYFQI
jgi:hypothetical protein